VKTTLETTEEDVKTTLETSGEDVKTTLETSGELVVFPSGFFPIRFKITSLKLKDEDFHFLKLMHLGMGRNCLDLQR
jgi:hypothetical protein